MTYASLQTTDLKLAPTARTFVVYDKKSGKVLHVHHHVSFGHEHKMLETAEAHALRVSGKRAGPNAAVLEVEATDVSGGKHVKVDVKRGKVVHIGAAPRSSSSRTGRKSAARKKTARRK